MSEFQTAEKQYVETLALAPDLTVASNNLALALAEQGEYDAALREIGIALAANHDAALERELGDTAAAIRRRKQGAD